jgi:hypothetical protein
VPGFSATSTVNAETTPGPRSPCNEGRKLRQERPFPLHSGGLTAESVDRQRGVATFFYTTVRPLPGFDKLATDRLAALASAGVETKTARDGTSFRIEIEKASPEEAADLLNRHLELESIWGEVLGGGDMRPAV